MADDPGDTGQRVAELRRRRGLSQRELAAEVGRSESWVSQVERGVQPIERLSILQTLADALGVPLRALRPDASEVEQAERPETSETINDLDGLRLALTGHPSLAELVTGTSTVGPIDVADLNQKVDQAWSFVHASRFAQASDQLSVLLPELEEAARHASGSERQKLHGLRARAYQATAAAFTRQDESDAAWVASDRALYAAEQAGDPLGVVAGLFRMAHAFLRLRRPDQAERAATSAIAALDPLVQAEDVRPETLSLYGAMHLVLAVIAGREGDRAAARQRITTARRVAKRLKRDRNDYNTEFGPTNVELHAVAVAVDLGDAGEALELAADIDARKLSPERQARFLVDVGRAHTQRRHVGEATAALLEAEKLAPEHVRGHHQPREAINDLLHIAERRASEDLLGLARRAGVA